MAVRTFLALDLDDDIRKGLVAAQRRIGEKDAKINWVARQNLHVTLKFLGDVEDAMLEEVCRLVAEAAGRIETFEFDVRGVIAVPPGGRIRMVWAGVDDPTGRTAALFAEIEKALAGLGFRHENRRFQPHITLARVKHARDPRALREAAAPLAEQDFGAQRAEHVTVYTSQLTPTGPVYTPAARPPLG